MKQRKVPLRKCVASQEMMPKKELIRVVSTTEGEVMIDLTRKQSGRRPYIFDQLDCFKLAQQYTALDRALKCQVSPEIYPQLARDFASVEGQVLAAKDSEDNE
ncbi:nucleic-acid-binding protein [Paenibacillus riograndensis]|nr:nucleic-acid-binding protein [Paenibacillus riograndensis]